MTSTPFDLFDGGESVTAMRAKLEDKIFQIECDQRKMVLKIVNKLFDKNETMLNNFLFLPENYFEKKEDDSYKIINKYLNDFPKEIREKIQKIKESSSKFKIYESMYELIKFVGYSLLPVYDFKRNKCYSIIKKKVAMRTKLKHLDD